MTSETIVPKMIVQYEWILENFGQERMMIASKMILFRGEKVFRLGLKNRADGPNLFLVAIDLNKMGMKVEDVKFRIQGSGLVPATNPTMMEMIKEDIGNEGSLQLFTATLEENVIGNCKIMFRICIEGTDSGYSYQLCDRLAKDQLWAAFKNHHHLPDVVLIVKDKTFPAHKSILAARSEVFADEFEKVQPVNGVRLQIRIDDVEPATVEKFLHFIYTGEPMGTLADEDLLKLAHHYQLKTLSGLCKLAAKKMDSMQMARVRKCLNGNAEDLSSSKSKIMPEKETEIFFDRTTVSFRCTSTFQLSRDGLKQPKVVMQYQNENICVAYNIGKTRFPALPNPAYIFKPEIHLSCAKHLRFGLKVEDVYCRLVKYAGVNEWLKMESRYFQRNSELLLNFSAKSLGTISDLESVPFDVKCISTIGNYYYEMMDEGWTKDFWVAATNKKFTDVKIYVGSVEVMEVHRVILCARCPILNLSVNNISNMGKSIVTFEVEFDVEVVKNFLNFLYTGSLKTTDNVRQLSKLATMYEVETLKKYVCQQLLNANPPVEEVTDYLFLL